MPLTVHRFVDNIFLVENIFTLEIICIGPKIWILETISTSCYTFMFTHSFKHSLMFHPVFLHFIWFRIFWDMCYLFYLGLIS